VYIKSFDEQRVLNTQRPYGAYNIPISTPDPGPDGLVGTADDPGRMLTYYDYSAALAGRAHELYMYINDPRSVERHKGIELQLTKRISNQWQLLAAFSATRSDMLVNHGSVGNVSANFTPNDEINTGDHSWQRTLRVAGLYRLPLGVNLSGNFQSITGDPVARTVLMSGGQQIPTLVINAEALGSLHLPTLNVLDFRLEKGFTLANRRRVSFRANLFNSLNVETATALQLRSGPTYLFPTAIIRPRIAEFSVSTDF